MVGCWTELREHFEIDEGALPDIVIGNLSPTELQQIFADLRRQGIDVSHGGSKVHIRRTGAVVDLDSVPDVALKIAHGDADSVHCVMRGIQVSGVTIPDLGIGVFPGEIILDYRPGSEWGPPELEALFEILKRIHEQAPAMTLRHGDPGVRLDEIWRGYLSRRAI